MKIGEKTKLIIAYTIIVLFVVAGALLRFLVDKGYLSWLIK